MVLVCALLLYHVTKTLFEMFVVDEPQTQRTMSTGGGSLPNMSKEEAVTFQ